VAVAVEVAVLVGVRVTVGVGVGVGERIETAPSAQDLARPRVHVIVTDDAPGLVLPAPMMSLGLVPVMKFHSWVWPAPGVAVSASPRAPSVSKTRSPTALATVTVGVSVLSPALTNVPRGVIWSTPENESAPAPKTAAAANVTVTVAVPFGGARRLQISMRLCVAWPFWAPTRVSDCAPYVTLETFVPVLIETPTSNSRFEPAPTVWLQDSVVDATAVNALDAGSEAIDNGMGRTRGSTVRGLVRGPAG